MHCVPGRSEPCHRNRPCQTDQILTEIVDVDPKPKGHQDDEDCHLEVHTPNALHAQITECFSEQVDQFLECDPSFSEIELLVY